MFKLTLILIAIVTPTIVSSINVCTDLYSEDGNVYDMTPIIDKRYSQRFQDYQFEFSICSSLPEQCHNIESSMCEYISETYGVSLGVFGHVEPIGMLDGTGVSLLYTNGTKMLPEPGQPKEQRRVYIDVLCDESFNDVSIVSFQYIPHTTTFNVNMKSKHACPVNRPPPDGDDGSDDGGDGEDGNDDGSDGGDNGYGPNVGLIVGIILSIGVMVGGVSGFVIYKKHKDRQNYGIFGTTGYDSISDEVIRPGGTYN